MCKKISSWYKRRSRRHPFNNYQTGAITFVQRFGSSLNLNLHFHTLFLDGIYQKPLSDAQQPTFIMASKPKDDEIKKLSEQISAAVIKMLDDKGVLERFKEQDPLLQYNLPLAKITGASIQHRIALGENAPSRVRRILQDPHEGQRAGHLCYASNGFSLHAVTHIPAWDRTGWPAPPRGFINSVITVTEQGLVAVYSLLRCTATILRASPSFTNHGALWGEPSRQ